MTRILGKDHAYTLWAVNDLAKIYTSQGRALEATEMLTAILDVVRQTLGEDHIKITMTLANIASAYSKLGRFDDAALILGDLYSTFYARSRPGRWIACTRIFYRAYIRKPRMTFVKNE